MPEIQRMMEVYLGGSTKTKALIAAGHSPNWAHTNTDRMPLPKNYRHVRFADGLFLFNWNQTKAAIYAGYNPKYAATNTSRLMRHPDVQAHILRIRQQMFPLDYPS